MICGDGVGGSFFYCIRLVSISAAARSIAFGEQKNVFTGIFVGNRIRIAAASSLLVG